MSLPASSSKALQQKLSKPYAWTAMGEDHRMPPHHTAGSVHPHAHPTTTHIYNLRTHHTHQEISAQFGGRHNPGPGFGRCARRARLSAIHRLLLALLTRGPEQNQTCQQKTTINCVRRRVPWGGEGGRRDSVGEALPCVACLPHQSSLFGLHLPLTRVARQTHAFCTRQFAVPAALPFLLPSPNWRGFITSDKLFHHTTSIASFQPSAISIYDAVRVLFARILTLRPLRRNTHSSKTQTSIQP